MLAYYVEWHMRKALAPMLFGQDGPRESHEDVVSPKKPSPSAARKPEPRKRSMEPQFTLFRLYWLIYPPLPSP